MIITKHLDLLEVLHGAVSDGLYQAMNRFNLVEQEVVLKVTSFTPGRPAQTYGPPENCYPAEAAEWQLQPTMDYGEVVVNLLHGHPHTTRYADEFPAIYKIINDNVLLLDCAEEVFSAVERERDDYEEAQAISRYEASL